MRREAYRQDVLVGEMAKEALGHLARVAQEVFVPLLGSARSDWSEMVAREAMEALNGFVANVQVRGDDDGCGTT